MSTEVLLASGYAAFLVGAALGLDAMARHSHHRSGRYRTAGFTYRDHLDVWECPEGEHLRRQELDDELRLVRYRARADVCNACPSKGACTDSDRGREIVRPLDPWPHSEAGRFHRGISLALLLLSVLVAGVALLRNQEASAVLLLGTVLVVAGSLLVRMTASFRAAPRIGFRG